MSAARFGGGGGEACDGSGAGEGRWTGSSSTDCFSAGLICKRILPSQTHAHLHKVKLRLKVLAQAQVVLPQQSDKTVAFACQAGGFLTIC